jgi:cytochrome c oxidase subunit II
MPMQHTSVFHPDSPQARAIVHLFYFDLVIAACIFVTVATLVAVAVKRFRWKPGASEPYQDPGNPKLETLWTVIPALILIALAVQTARTMHFVNPPVIEREPDVVVIAHQWWWEYRYPQSDVITANELHMPAEENWLLLIEAADVIHDFWVPDLGAKMDAIPGHPNHLWIQPQRAGTYLGSCAEYCGLEHALMGIRVIVQPKEDFAAWVRSQLVVPGPPVGAVAQEGARLFQERTCVNCHRIAGTPANGRVGPDLTHLADRETLGAGVFDNTLDNLTRWIQNPQQFKPGCHMPDERLSEVEAHAIATYLEALK